MAKLLISERDNLNKTFEDFFQALGYSTYASDDPKEVVDIARREKPDVVMMDVRMGSEGHFRLDVIDDIKKIDNAIKIIVMSTYSKGDEEIDLIMKHKVDKYYSKPIDLEKLLTDVKIMTKNRKKS